MDLAAELFETTCQRHDLDPEGIVLHSDNGAAMKGSTMLATLQRLGVVASFSRPRVSDDNPYSEALFRTLKYRPEYPSGPFASLGEASRWVESFVRWYNREHLHSAIRFVKPEDRHSGQEEEILRQRHRVYERARRRSGFDQRGLRADDDRRSGPIRLRPGDRRAVDAAGVRARGRLSRQLGGPCRGPDRGRAAALIPGGALPASPPSANWAVGTLHAAHWSAYAVRGVCMRRIGTNTQQAQRGSQPIGPYVSRTETSWNSIGTNGSQSQR